MRTFWISVFNNHGLFLLHDLSSVLDDYYEGNEKLGGVMSDWVYGRYKTTGVKHLSPRAIGLEAVQMYKGMF